MTNILEEIAGKTKIRVEEQKKKKSLEEMKQEALHMNCETGFPFENALAGEDISFICEVKKASPSKGIIAEDFPYMEIARDYEKAGAAAISVLTEPEYFKGSNEILKEIAGIVNIPIIRKDFTVDEYQIYEAKVIGASAVLLICAILEEEQIKNYIKIADSLGLSALVEAHDEAEVKMAIACNARIIGVNNRNLKDFTVDINNSVQLRKCVPKEITFVSESGIRTHEDIHTLVSNHTNAVLIGETFMRSNEKSEMLHQLRTGRKTRIKICGITKEEEVEAINQLSQEIRPDYIGFVFAKSKRRVAEEQAQKLRALLDQHIETVGVFVDESQDFIVRLVQKHIIDLVQLHGEEDGEYIRTLREQIPTTEIIKAVKVRNHQDVKDGALYESDYLLLDTFSKEGAGGNGACFNWSLVKEAGLEEQGKPYFLAGGLSSENVNQAVELLHPFAVDVSSGVEGSAGKDITKIIEFINQVK